MNNMYGLCNLWNNSFSATTIDSNVCVQMYHITIPVDILRTDVKIVLDSDWIQQHILMSVTM